MCPAGAADGQDWCGRLFAQETLQGLVEALHLAAGLRMVQGGVFEDDIRAFQLCLEQDPVAVDGTDVAEQRGRVAMSSPGEVEALHHVSSPDGSENVAGEKQPGWST
jgi:hypothetical protein